jgi:single-strand DNA-binding protein
MCRAHYGLSDALSDLVKLVLSEPTSSGTAVANFSLATDVGWGDNKSTVWFLVNAWDKQAEFVNQYLTKGRVVLVVGELSLSEYTTAGGENRTSLELRAREIKFGGDAPDRNAAPNVSGAAPAAPPATPVAPTAPAEPAPEDIEELPW